MAAVGGRYPAQRKYRTDGGRSFVRKALGTDFPGESMNARAVVAGLSLSGLEDDIWHRWNGGGAQQISLCPLANSICRMQASPPPSPRAPEARTSWCTPCTGARTMR